jgi:hypothetical protein
MNVILLGGPKMNAITFFITGMINIYYYLINQWQGELERSLLFLSGQHKETFELELIFKTCLIWGIFTILM